MIESPTEQLADGIHRIPLPLPLDDLQSINAYALESSAGLVLIDPGWASEVTDCVLRAAVSELGYRMEDISSVVATHGHWDHYTQALDLRRDYGSRLYLGEDERYSIDAFRNLDGVYPRQVELLRAAGAEELADIIDALHLQPHEAGISPAYPDVWMQGGDVLEFGDRTLFAHATPGHTRGHTVIVDPRAGITFTGDHILPRITPSIAFERDPDRNALPSFLSSLRLMLALPDTRMLPAHGPVSPSVHDRAFELLAHHDERLTTIRDLGADGKSPHQIARSMPWTRRNRRLDDLSPVHQMVAVLEVAAHLSYEYDPTPELNRS